MLVERSVGPIDGANYFVWLYGVGLFVAGVPTTRGCTGAAGGFAIPVVVTAEAAVVEAMMATDVGALPVVSGRRAISPTTAKIIPTTKIMVAPKTKNGAVRLGLPLRDKAFGTWLIRSCKQTSSTY